MKRTAYILLSAATALLVSAAASAQSRSFRLGQWEEIHSSILKELNGSYVDSLPVDRIMRAGIDEMLGSLDPYTMYVPEEENEDFQMMISKTYGGIGAIIYKKKGGNVVINEPYYGSPAYKAGLVCGDEIISIDGYPTKDLETAQSSDRMKGKPGTTVVFKVKKVRTGDTLDVPVVRERIHLPDVEYVGMLDDTTGYIVQSGFTENVSNDIKNAVLRLRKEGMKRLVLDLRGNGGGLMNEAINIVSLFVPKGSLVVTARGLDPESCREYRTVNEPVDTLLPLIVLVDSGSASSSEIVAGAIQDRDRGVVMGTRTFGKGLVQSIRPVAYNGQLKVTTAKYYTPSGRCVQAIDYSHRNEDGSVGHIPDSLTREFTTLHGRKVRDGGGITPDIEIKSPSYSRLVYSLVLSGVIDNFVLEYVRQHGSIPPVDEFHLSDEEFEDFIDFARTREFDYRSSAMTLFDQMKKELEKDGLAESMADEISALEKGLEMDKEKFIRLKKDEIIPFIEEEIAVRYYYQEAGVKIRLRYDDQLKEALAAELPDLTGKETAEVIFFGDPYVLLASDGRYYMYGTGGVRDGFGCYVSDNLEDWRYLGPVYRGNTEESWAESSFWAPEVYEKDGRFYMFFSAQWKVNPTDELENFRIGVAVADSPAGPFREVSDGPLFDPGYPVIDANVLMDDDGRYYLYYSRCCYKHPVESEIADWARQKGLFDEIEESWIYGVELKPDFSGIIGEPELLLCPPKKMSDAQAEWESRSVTSGAVNRRWTEGSFIIKKDGLYYMMYSANFFGGQDYAVGYAVSDSPLGPFRKSEDNPVLEKNTQDGGLVSGVGHNSITWSKDGRQLYCVYHGRTAATGGERVVFIDRMEIRDGHLIVHGPGSEPLKAVR